MQEIAIGKRRRWPQKVGFTFSQNQKISFTAIFPKREFSDFDFFPLDDLLWEMKEKRVFSAFTHGGVAAVADLKIVFLVALFLQENFSRIKNSS